MSEHNKNRDSHKPQFINHSEFESKAIIKEFKQLPNSETIVVQMGLMSGKDISSNQRYINGSFVVGKELLSLVRLLITADLGKGLVCEVTISDLSITAKPNNSKPDQPYVDIGGILKRIVCS